jgi:hypothetical protein
MAHEYERAELDRILDMIAAHDDTYYVQGWSAAELLIDDVRARLEKLRQYLESLPQGGQDAP